MACFALQGLTRGPRDFAMAFAWANSILLLRCARRLRGDELQVADATPPSCAPRSRHMAGPTCSCPSKGLLPVAPLSGSRICCSTIRASPAADARGLCLTAALLWRDGCCPGQPACSPRKLRETAGEPRADSSPGAAACGNWRTAPLLACESCWHPQPGSGCATSSCRQTLERVVRATIQPTRSRRLSSAWKGDRSSPCCLTENPATRKICPTGLGCSRRHPGARKPRLPRPLQALCAASAI